MKLVTQDRTEGLARLRAIALEVEKQVCIESGRGPDGDPTEFAAWNNQFYPDELTPMDRPEGKPVLSDDFSHYYLLDDGTIIEWIPAGNGSPAHQGGLYPPDCGMPPKVKSY